MNKAAIILFSFLLPPLASAATPWKQWYGTYVRLEDDGNIACLSIDGGRNCDWNYPNAVPAASAPRLVCGADHKSKWSITGYETPRHWCNRAYADLYADWKAANYFGFDVYLSVNPAGELMCNSGDSMECWWNLPLGAPAPVKPVEPLACGPMSEAVWGAASNDPSHWCQQARRVTHELDYSHPMWANESFAYEKGWAGTGFGLSGSQRGAPEVMALKEKNGHKGLAIASVERSAEFMKRYANTIYGVPDKELQDDFMVYVKEPWTVEDEPVATMHVYLSRTNVTSLRMPVVFNIDGGTGRAWPGIWLTPSGIRMRTTRGDYYTYDTALNDKGRWWTLGLKVVAGGDLEYYAAPQWIASPFEPRFLRGKMNSLLGTTQYSLLRQNDATLMISNVMQEGLENIIGDIRYGVKTEGQKRRR
ncbi:hypothetical protein [Pseudomonas turukhanskensis]|uniref:Uncharacterized protein n=1 Tax=Pseudomonas turukhanskensis TaxID=1806536 RepID=A0A9W6K3X6_9PSED|nr:hypothetical protein [Pseudomonas turukhanskensis]GLK87798.1 hypothetical protein GCM10017655_08600 [Pseudomonas turukhanskensis]